MSRGMKASVLTLSKLFFNLAKELSQVFHRVASKGNKKTPTWQLPLTAGCTSKPIFNHSVSVKLPIDSSYMVPQGRSTEELPIRSQYKFQVNKQLF